WDVLSSTRMKVTSLEKALNEAKVGDADFIKLDTQGSELFILQGGIETLSQSIFGVEVEVEFAELYEGQPLFPDVDQFLRSLGFILFDMRTIYWKRENAKGVGGRKGQIVFADALYFKSIKEFLNRGVCQKSKLLKALTICVVYGYFDYALSLCAQAKNLNILDDQEYKLASECLEKPRHLSALWPWFRGRDRFANMIYMIYDIFRSHDWSHSGSSGRYLGNTGDPLFRG
ncbi:MAG: FkbM family methyltransferase, partial [Thaumarchaeota archaeon]|nr:FkbM family methyltransferase [Nitrososphaerota archaeon]